MKYLSKKNIVILIVILLSIISIVVYDRINIKEYVLVSNDQDITNKINEQFIKYEITNLEDLYDMSSDSIMAYSYLTQLVVDDFISIDDLSHEQQAQLIYLLVTNGSESVCFSKKYFQKLALRYLDISSFKVKFNDDMYYGKNNLFHGYCFEQYFIDSTSNISFVLYDIDDDIVTFTYIEEKLDNTSQLWNVNFENKNGTYYLKSLSIE